MVLPIMPIAPTNTIVNKKIVYSDTVLNLNELGKDIKITTINNVNDYEFESCLNCILQSNPNVVFNTIQYSKNNNKVYFYTNDYITIKEWENTKVFNYKPLNNKLEIIEELKRVLLSKDITDENTISLYDVYNVLCSNHRNINEIKEKYKYIIDDYLKSDFGINASCFIYDFDKDNNLLEIGFNEYSFDDTNLLDVYKGVTFSKIDNDLFIVESKNDLANLHLRNIGNIISELYDEILKFENSKSNYYRFLSSNSNFYISIFNSCIKITDKKNFIDQNYSLSRYVCNDDYEYLCNSNQVMEITKGIEDILFKKIHVHISDCPTWIQDKLYNIKRIEMFERKIKENELKKVLEIQEEKRLKKENKKQKVLEFRKKIFPWTK